MIQSFKSKLIKEGKLKKGVPTGKLLTNSSIKTVFIVLNSIFNDAIKLDHLKHSPARDIESVKIDRDECEPLTPQQIRRLLNATEEPYKTLFTVAVLTGCRRGEVLALRWSDIDFEKRLIFIRRSVFRKQFIKPKSKKSVRVLAMDDRLTQALYNHRLSYPPNELDLVFCTPEGGIIDGGHITKVQLKKAVKEAKINEEREKPLRFHDLRHSYASLLIARDVHTKKIQSVLGHANYSTTMDIYAHLLPESHVECAEQASSAIFDD